MRTMSITQQGTSSVAVDIPPGPSTRIIERASRTGANVRIDFEAHSQATTFVGKLLSSNRGSLVVRTTGPLESPLQSVCCDAAILLDSLEYMFAAHVLDVRTAGDGGTCVEISRPANLQTWQRRRFVRASIADSARVGFYESAEHEVPAFEGDMLNVSADGIACRVDARQADRYTIDDRIAVRFALRPDDRSYALCAVVRSKTPGGSPGAIIMGLQFTDTPDNRPERTQLAQALASYL